MPRLSKTERKALEAIPDDEYARQQIKYHEEEVKHWENELKEAIGENDV